MEQLRSVKIEANRIEQHRTAETLTDLLLHASVQTAGRFPTSILERSSSRPMPANKGNSAADIGQNAPNVDTTQDSISNGSYEPDADKNGSREASMQMGIDRTHSNLAAPTSEDSRNESMKHSNTHAPRTGRTTDNLLQVPTDTASSRHTIEASVWDWDTPLESVGESSSYYYEPQGELLQQQQVDQQQQRSEFSIPHVVSPASSHRQFIPSNSKLSDPLQALRRPQGVPPTVAGNKRKSTSDREPPSASKQPDPKRSSRMLMAESSEDVGSPADARTPAQNTRSHSGPSTRQRSLTEGSDGASAEAARAEAELQSKRTLENPAIPMVLPPRKVFPIQIGDKLFRLSGASISSDGKLESTLGSVSESKLTIE